MKNQPLKTPITYYGGKQMMTRYILPLIPTHELYCEPFFGGGAILFAKEPSQTEVINDLNSEAINFYRTVKLRFNELQVEVTSTLHSREEFRQAQVVYSNPEMFTEVKRAWAFYTNCNQSFSANLSSWGFGRSSTSSLKLKNKRENFTETLAKRLENVQIECVDALRVIKGRDQRNSFFYIDPPYFNSNCGPYKGYTKEDFGRLLELLTKVKGKFLLSSYPSDILTQYTKANKWYKMEIVKPVAVSAGVDKMKTEVLTANYEIPLK